MGVSRLHPARWIVSGCLIAMAAVFLVAQLPTPLLQEISQPTAPMTLATAGPTTTAPLAETVTAASTKGNAVLMESTAEPNSTSLQIASLLTALVGIVGLIFGIYQYGQAQKVKRQQILFELIHEYNYSEEQRLAKRILDDFYVDKDLKKRGIQFKQPNEYYYVSHLGQILRWHGRESIEDPGEEVIRESFDALLEFFGKLEYLLELGLIKKNELLYFDYFLRKTLDNEAVRKYARDYPVPLYQKLQGRFASRQS
jgi:hypothetical protein